MSADPRSLGVAGGLVTGGTVLERAQSACLEAKQLEKIGEYQTEYELLSEYWPDRSVLPTLPDLPPEVRGELLLRIGALACWLGSVEQTTGSQDLAKDIIGEALMIFDSLGWGAKVAEARGDLGLCYWREGAFDEARIQFATALQLVPESEADLRAILLVRAGIVEVDAHRLNTALTFYNEALPLVDASQDEAIKGSFHFSFGVLFQGLSLPENREDYLDKSLVEYSAASFHFEQAGNVRAQARVENNLGNLFCVIGRYQEAHKHLDRARVLFVDLGDVGTVACVDETRARAFLGEGRFVEAERMIKLSVKALEKGDQQAVLTEALITYGVIVAQLGRHERSRVLFDRAIRVAETSGDVEGVGRAQLSIIEQLQNKLPEKELVTLYLSAMELLKKAEDPAISQRLIQCSGSLLTMMAEEELSEPIFDEDFLLKDYVLEAEERVIRRALREAHGSVTKAAKLLGYKHHQSLISMINTRHRGLLDNRSPIRVRKRTWIKKKRSSTSPSARTSGIARLKILYVGSHEVLGKLIGVGSVLEASDVVECPSLESAAQTFDGGGFRAVVIGSTFERAPVLDFVREVRKAGNSARLSLIVAAPADWEDELWRAGVDAFVSQADGVPKLTSAIERALSKE